MRNKKIVLLVLFGCFLCGKLVAQSSHSPHYQTKHTKTNQGRSPFRMKRSKARIVCPIFADSKYPYHGIGFKLGDPFAITYKYYASETLGIVADFGKASSGLYNRYYREQFKKYISADTLTDEANVDYLTHKAKADWVGELKVLYHFNASGISPGLKAYIGVGAQVKSTHISYQYLYHTDPEGNSNISTLRQAEKTRFTYGPEGVAGIEYSYFKIPISAFMEVEYYYDLGLDPGWQRFQGGAGLRYVFR